MLTITIQECHWIPRQSLACDRSCWTCDSLSSAHHHLLCTSMIPPDVYQFARTPCYPLFSMSPRLFTFTLRVVLQMKKNHSSRSSTNFSKFDLWTPECTRVAIFEWRAQRVLLAKRGSARRPRLRCGFRFFLDHRSPNCGLTKTLFHHPSIQDITMDALRERMEVHLNARVGQREFIFTDPPHNLGNLLPAVGYFIARCITHRRGGGVQSQQHHRTDRTTNKPTQKYPVRTVR